MIRTLSIAGAAVIASLLLAGPAMAAPDHTAKFGDANASSTWQGSPNVGIAPTAEAANALGCDVRMCDDMLVEVTEPGRLTINVLGNEPTAVDIDLYVFSSNAAGDALTELGRVTDFDADEQFTVAKAKPGFYLVRTDWALGAGTFTGTLGWKPEPKPTT